MAFAAFFALSTIFSCSTTLLVLDYFRWLCLCRALSCSWFLDYWTSIRVIVEVNGFSVRSYCGQEGARLSFFFLLLDLLFRWRLLFILIGVSLCLLVWLRCRLLTLLSRLLLLLLVLLLVLLLLLLLWLLLLLLWLLLLLLLLLLILILFTTLSVISRSWLMTIASR